MDESRVDEELERELSVTTLHLLVQTTLDAINTTSMELGMLEEMVAKKVPLQGTPKPGEEDTARVEAARPKSRPTAWSGPLLSESGAPLRPFIITNQRQALQDRVFRPGHSLPTMSVEEYLDREFQRGNVLSGGT